MVEPVLSGRRLMWEKWALSAVICMLFGAGVP